MTYVPAEISVHPSKLQKLPVKTVHAHPSVSCGLRAQDVNGNSGRTCTREQKEDSKRVPASGLLDAARWLRRRSIEDGRGAG